MTEKEIIGNWVVAGGSGEGFDKEMIGAVFNFNKDHKVQRMEDGDLLEGDWKFENNVITVTEYYNDGINDPDIQTLTIITFDGKKWKANYSDNEDEQFIISFERARMP